MKKDDFNDDEMIDIIYLLLFIAGLAGAVLYFILRGCI